MKDVFDVLLWHLRFAMKYLIFFGRIYVFGAMFKTHVFLFYFPFQINLDIMEASDQHLKKALSAVLDAGILSLSAEAAGFLSQTKVAPQQTVI